MLPAEKRKFAAYLAVTGGILAALVLATIAAGIVVSYLRARARTEQEAVWLARYLAQYGARTPVAEIAPMIAAEQGITIETNAWHPLADRKIVINGRTALLFNTNVLRGDVCVITHDGFIKWVPQHLSK